MKARSAPTNSGADCLHCGLPVPSRLVASDGPSFCCAGCRLVHSILKEQGLGEFYRLRERTGGGWPDHPVDEASLETADVAYAHYDSADFAERFVQEAEDGTRGVRLFLEGVHCAACVWLMDQLPRVMPGVVESRLDQTRQELALRWDPERCSLSEIASLLQRLGYPSHARGRDADLARRREDRRELVRLGVSFAISGNTMMIGAALYAAELGGGMDPAFRRFLVWVSLGLAVPAVSYGAAPFYRAALSGLRVRVAHMDLPISLGILAGFIASVWGALTGGDRVYFDSVTTLVFLLLLGRWLLRRGQRAALAGSELMGALTPAMAIQLRGGVRHGVPVASLVAGDVVCVDPGALFPVDGRLVEGDTHVDQSLISGEAHPVKVSAAQHGRVLAGTRNLTREVAVEAIDIGPDTRVARLVDLTDRAGGARAGVVRMADALSGYFVLAVLVVAATAGLVWWSIDAGRVFDVVVSVLIVSCPCALGIATPVALAVARGRAARAGFLLRSGAALERIAGAKQLVLDKTGTLTEGALAVSWSWIDASRVTAREVATMIEVLEARAKHPAARALLAWARLEAEESGGSEADEFDAAAASGWIERPGSGVEARVDGTYIAIGSPAVLGTESSRDRVLEVVQSGASPIVLRRGEHVVAVFGVDDRVRPEARVALDRFRKMGLEIRVLSGDHPEVVRRVAGALGIEHWRGEATPESKAAEVASSARVCMVGDGVNDAPALRAAYAGIAVAGGAEAALGVADAYLARPGLDGVADLVEGSRRAIGVVRRNLAFSLAYNALFATLAVLGHVTPLAAAILMPLSSLTVVASSVLARTFEPASAVASTGPVVQEESDAPRSSEPSMARRTSPRISSVPAAARRMRS